jgi:F0F1-type ATP synthase membrane subunit b/b'
MTRMSKRSRWATALAVGAALSLASSVVLAEHSPGDTGAAHETADSHSDAAHSAAAHGSPHGHDAPTLDSINWFEGLLGGRSESTPAPFGALLINSAILFFLIIKLGGPKIQGGLLGRRNRLAADIDAAKAMHLEAEAQLKHYQAKLAKMESEAEAILATMRDNAVGERERVLKEAHAQRDKLVRDAEARVAQELSLQREHLVRQLVQEAVRAAEGRIEAGLEDRDHTWFGERILKETQAGAQGVKS